MRKPEVIHYLYKGADHVHALRYYDGIVTHIVCSRGVVYHGGGILDQITHTQYRALASLYGEVYTGI